MRKLNAVVMTLAGSLLIAASILKAHEVFTVYIPSWQEKGVWESWEMMLVQIPAEFALGVWMVSGVFRKAGWLAGTASYGFFIGVTIYKVLSGAASCGCFGRVEVDPKITLFTIDIPFFVLLALFRPKGLKLLPPPWPNVWHAIGTAIPVFAALVFMAPVLVAFRPEFKKPENWTSGTPIQRPPQNPQLIEPKNVTTPVTPDPNPTTPIHVEPVKPVDPDPVANPTEPVTEPVAPQPEPKPDPGQTTSVTEPPKVEPEAPKLWPWLEHIDIAKQMKEGLVIAYMYHHDCSTCAKSVPKYEEYIKKMKEIDAVEFQLAYLAIPPYSTDGSGPVPADTTTLHGKLTDKEKWAITSPFVVALLDGSVVKQWPQGSAPEPDMILDEIFAP